MADIERQYPYKPKWRAILLIGGYFTLGAVACGYKIAHPWPENVPVLYWIALVSGLVGAVLPGVAAVERLWRRRRVAFTSTALLLPKPGWSSEEEAIDYRMITGLRVSKSRGGGPQYLYVMHRGGRRRIAEAWLPSRAAFEAVCQLLIARAQMSEQLGHAGPGVASDHDR
jgi:hypothetical protein